jgi:hypothetical protein
MKPVLGAALLALALSHPAAALPADEAVTVYRTPWCGCCHAWAEELEKAGYQVKSVIQEDLSQIRKQAGVPADMEGCHVASVDGYFLEGHVPLEAIRKLQVDNRPDIAGLAVPGMPQGSLGMGPDPTANYEVLAVSRDPSVAPSVFFKVGN